MRIHHSALDRTVDVPDSTAEVLIETAGWHPVSGDAPVETNPDGFPLDLPATDDDASLADLDDLTPEQIAELIELAEQTTTPNTPEEG